MGQVKTGTIAVTNGNARVIGSPDADWSDSKRGDTAPATNWLSLIGSPTVYQIADIFPPGTGGNTTSDRWEATVVGVVSDATDAEAEYVLHWWFTAKKHLPLFEPNDEQTAQLWNYAMNILDNIEAGAVAFHELVISGGDVDADRVFFPFAPPLGADPQNVSLPVQVKGDPDEDNNPVVSVDTISEAGYYINLQSPAQDGQTYRNTYTP